jgi:hypothetical protein
MARIWPHGFVGPADDGATRLCLLLVLFAAPLVARATEPRLQLDLSGVMAVGETISIDIVLYGDLHFAAADLALVVTPADATRHEGWMIPSSLLDFGGTAVRTLSAPFITNADAGIDGLRLASYQLVASAPGTINVALDPTLSRMFLAAQPTAPGVEVPIGDLAPNIIAIDIVSDANSVVVPLPAWAVVMLGAAMVGVAWLRRRCTR